MADEELMFGDLFATVRVQDLPASREVVAVERQDDGAWRVCGSAVANADGIAELGIEGSKTSRIYAVAIDHWGEPFIANKPVKYGDVIRPSVFLGWLYRVTTPGTLPDDEPVWWNSTPGMPRPVGTATAQAEMYFQPIAHGPVDIEWEELLGGDPHWANVVALLNFEDSLVGNSAGADWSVSGSPLRDPVDSLRGGYSIGIYDKDSDVYSYPPIGFGSRPSTVEFLMRPRSGSSLSDQRMFCLDRSASAGLQGIIVQSVLMFYRGAGFGSDVRMKGSTPIIAGHEYHVALSHDGTTLRLFLNGNLESSAVIPSWILTGEPFRFGRNLNPSYVGNRVPFVGELDELRITDGVCRYTENFTPPTEPFPNFGPSGSST